MNTFIGGGGYCYELFGQEQVENEESAGACDEGTPCGGAGHDTRGRVCSTVREWEGVAGLAGGHRAGELQELQQTAEKTNRGRRGKR